MESANVISLLAGDPLQQTTVLLSIQYNSAFEFTVVQSMVIIFLKSLIIADVTIWNNCSFLQSVAVQDNYIWGLCVSTEFFSVFQVCKMI